MAWTQADIDALKAAYALGARKVKYADKEIEYTSPAQMLEALRTMQAEVSPGATGARGRRKFGQFSKGL